MRRTTLLTALALVAAVALVVIGGAGGAPANDRDKGKDKGKGKGKVTQSASTSGSSATPVFKLRLKPGREVPPITGLDADAVGNVTFDLTRDSAGAITSGEAVFYFNYKFPGSVNITGLHVHKGAKGTNGDIVIDSGVAAFTDSDGAGNVTTVVTGVSPTLLQAILDKPRDYYANLHTSVNLGGALRDQLHHPKKR
jgi:CHRD domain-containing protein